MKLKTLNDIAQPFDMTAELLKAEAVKWVKEDQRCLKEGIKDRDVKISTEARIDWITYFFSLTLEDLQ